MVLNRYGLNVWIYTNASSIFVACMCGCVVPYVHKCLHIFNYVCVNFPIHKYKIYYLLSIHKIPLQL